VLRKIFGPKWGKVEGGWKRLHNEEHRNLYTSPSIIRVIISRKVTGGTGNTHGRDEKCLEAFGRKPERMRPLGRNRCRWEDSIRIDNREIGWEGVDWIHLVRGTD
jgi:hypothetical protein